jgi:hypothetical protein
MLKCIVHLINTIRLGRIALVIGFLLHSVWLEARFQYPRGRPQHLDEMRVHLVGSGVRLALDVVTIAELLPRMDSPFP